jgi:hypothetical protein
MSATKMAGGIQQACREWKKLLRNGRVFSKSAGSKKAAKNWQGFQHSAQKKWSRWIAEGGWVCSVINRKSGQDG